MKNLLLACCIAMGIPAIVYSQGVKKSYTIPFRGRSIVLDTETNREFSKNEQSYITGKDYVLALFKEYPASAKDGNKALLIADHLYGKAYYVQLLRGLTPAEKATVDFWYHPLREDKIDPSLLKRQLQKYIQYDSTGKPFNYVLNKDSTLNVVVTTFKNVDIDTFLIVLTRYAEVTAQVSSKSWSIRSTYPNMLKILNEKQVLYIQPRSPEPEMEMDGTRDGVHVTELQQINLENGNITGLTGKCLEVGIYDSGIDEHHNDMGGRIIVHSGIVSDHGTHVGGIVGANGFMSDKNDSQGNSNGGTPYQWRGVAPKAYLIDQVATKNLPVVTYHNIADAGMDLSNHSYTMAFDGVYDAANIAADEMVAGLSVHDNHLIPRRLRVYAAGNEGKRHKNETREQLGYFSLVNQGKNTLLVGNYNLDSRILHDGSSLGPAYDGRIKPDIIAPGRSIKSTKFELLDDGTEVHNGYISLTGTSMASPVVTGIAALVLEKYRERYTVNIDNNPPLPSTLKAILINSADDIESDTWFNNIDGPVLAFRGPDYATGFGLVNAESAVQHVIDKKIIEDVIETTCEKKRFRFYVSHSRLAPVKVTLAWDDFPSSAALEKTAAKLVNDLDLVLIDPKGGRHYPWLLNQRILDDAGNEIEPAQQLCGTSVTVSSRLVPNPDVNFIEENDPGNISEVITADLLGPAINGRDHLNNVEQVVIPPVQGYWTAEVSGFAIAEGPQSFSVAGIKPIKAVKIDPTSLCTKFGLNCTKVFTCSRFPGFCTPRSIIPFEGGFLTKFKNFNDKIFLGLEDICQKVLGCPGCGNNSLCTGEYDLVFSGIANPVEIEIFDSNGRSMTRKKISKNNSSVRFTVTGDLHYILSIKPAFVPEVNKYYEIPLSIALQKK